jgi:hypothetical protein
MVATRTLICFLLASTCGMSQTMKDNSLNADERPGTGVTPAISSAASMLVTEGDGGSWRRSDHFQLAVLSPTSGMGCFP